MSTNHTDRTKRLVIVMSISNRSWCVSHRGSVYGSENTIQPQQATRVVPIGGARASNTMALVFRCAGHEAQYKYAI